MAALAAKAVPWVVGAFKSGAATTAITAGSAAVTAKSAMDSNKIAKQMSKKPPAPLLPDDESVRRAGRRAAALRFGAMNGGRASTILSDNNNQTLGG